MSGPGDKNLLVSDEEMAASLDDRSDEIARRRLVANPRTSETVRAARDAAKTAEEPGPVLPSERVEATTAAPAGPSRGRVETTGKIKWKDPRSATTAVVRRPADPRRRLLLVTVALLGVVLGGAALVWLVTFYATPTATGPIPSAGTPSAPPGAPSPPPPSSSVDMTASASTAAPPSTVSSSAPISSASPSQSGALTAAPSSASSSASSRPPPPPARSSGVLWRPEDDPP